jgi:hypothetical protein
MTLNVDNSVFRPKISKPLGCEKFFQLQVGHEEISLGTYVILIKNLLINILKISLKIIHKL